MDQWLELTDGSFKGFAFHVAIPTFGLDSHGATDVTVSSGRRIHKIQRPFVDGQRTIDLGAEGDEVTVDLIFFGPTYLDRFEEFKVLLNQGTSGKLILPDRREALNATFLKMQETSRSGEASSKGVRVTWVQDEVLIKEQAVGAESGLIPQGVINSVNKVTNVISKAGAVLRNNPILATIRQFETITSQATSAVVTVVSLGEAVRQRVLTTIANLEATFATIASSVAQIGSLFGNDSPGSGFEEGRIDNNTGLPIIDGLAPETETVIIDPLDTPLQIPDNEITILSLESDEGLTAFKNDTIKLLQDSEESLALDTDGRTSDVSGVIAELINSIRDVIEAANPTRTKTVVTPFELSLAEILFANNIELTEIDNILKRNSFIVDIHIIPQGSVISL